MAQRSSVSLHLFLLLVILSCLLASGISADFRNRRALARDVSAQVLITEEMATEQDDVMLENHGRIDLQTQDYPGSGANSRHDPRNPGKP